MYNWASLLVIDLYFQPTKKDRNKLATDKKKKTKELRTPIKKTSSNQNTTLLTLLNNKRKTNNKHNNENNDKENDYKTYEITDINDVLDKESENNLSSQKSEIRENNSNSDIDAIENLAEILDRPINEIPYSVSPLSSPIPDEVNKTERNIVHETPLENNDSSLQPQETLPINQNVVLREDTVNIVENKSSFDWELRMKDYSSLNAMYEKYLPKEDTHHNDFNKETIDNSKPVIQRNKQKRHLDEVSSTTEIEGSAKVSNRNWSRKLLTWISNNKNTYFYIIHIYTNCCFPLHFDCYSIKKKEFCIKNEQNEELLLSIVKQKNIVSQKM